MLRVLIVGFGDVAQRVARLLQGRARVYALVRGEATRRRAEAVGAIALSGDLDQLSRLRRVSGLADAVIHLAPPDAADPAAQDRRTQRLLAALAQGARPRRLVYISTTGVYGDQAGARVNETTPLRTASARAARRVAAERSVRAWTERAARAQRVRFNAKRVRISRAPITTILRVPGIYARERLPLERLRARQPVLEASADVYTNHIHADDLAHVILSALFRGRHNRVYNACDESELRMGEYFDCVADAFALPRAPRVTREEAQRVISPASLSFMSESRRLSNARLRKELRVSLSYPTVQRFLESERG